MQLADLLPAVNACLNGLAAFFLIGGFVAIKRGRRELHKRFMLGAFGASTVFLASYLTRYALTGTTHFPVGGGWKVAYLVILFSHMFLAMGLVPMVLRTVWLPWKGRYEQHRSIARWTFPIWAYVSLTGVVVYFMLYHLPRWLCPASGPQPSECSAAGPCLRRKRAPSFDRCSERARERSGGFPTPTRTDAIRWG